MLGCATNKRGRRQPAWKQLAAQSGRDMTRHSRAGESAGAVRKARKLESDGGRVRGVCPWW